LSQSLLPQSQIPLPISRRMLKASPKIPRRPRSLPRFM
jgi:hypothetical protein